MCKINHCDVKYNGDDVQRTGSGDVTALFILTCQPSPLLLPVYLNQGVRKCEREEVDAPTTTFYTPSPPLRPAETYLPLPHSPTRHTLCLVLHPRQDVKDPWDPPSSALPHPGSRMLPPGLHFQGAPVFLRPLLSVVHSMTGHVFISVLSSFSSLFLNTQMGLVCTTKDKNN